MINKREIFVELVHPSCMDEKFNAQWQTLSENAVWPNPFFEPWFLKSALKFFDKKQEVQLCSVFSGSGDERQLVGLVPLRCAKRYRILPIRYYEVWTHSHGFMGMPLILPDYEQEFYSALAMWLTKEKSKARFIQFLSHPMDDQRRKLLSEAFGTKNLFVQEKYRRAYLVGSESYEDYSAKVFSSKQRSELRRVGRNLSNCGRVEVNALTIDDNLVDLYFRLEATGWKNPQFSNRNKASIEADQCFFREAMKKGSKLGHVTCFGLLLNDQVIALSIQLVRNEYIAGFKTVYDEAYKVYSPGAQVLHHTIRDMLEEPAVSEFDSCSVEGQPLLERIMRDRMPIAQMNAIMDDGMLRILMNVLHKSAR